MACCANDHCSSDNRQPDGRYRRVLWVALVLNGGMFLTEIVAGLAAGSAALQADAVDFLSDAANYGISLSVLGLVLYTSAFVCEAVRSGINSVPAGQAEAARAVGLTFTQSLASVILPQALRTVVPPLASVIIAMIKNSAIVGAFGVGGDLFAVGDTLTCARGEAALPVLTGVVIGYLILTIPAGLGLGALERKVAIAR